MSVLMKQIAAYQRQHVQTQMVVTSVHVVQVILEMDSLVMVCMPCCWIHLYYKLPISMFLILQTLMNVTWKILVTPTQTVRTLLVVTCAVVEWDTVEMAIVVKV